MEKENKRKSGVNSGSDQSPCKEKRLGIDRRTNNKARFKYLLFNGRRERFRRDEDQLCAEADDVAVVLRQVAYLATAERAPVAADE